MILEDVKRSLGMITDDVDLNRTIEIKIASVKEYLKNAGASELSINSDLALDCITIGVNDLMNQQAGEIKFSPAFVVLSNQLCRM